MDVNEVVRYVEEHGATSLEHLGITPDQARLLACYGLNVSRIGTVYFVWTDPERLNSEDRYIRALLEVWAKMADIAIGGRIGVCPGKWLVRRDRRLVMFLHNVLGYAYGSGPHKPSCRLYVVERDEVPDMYSVFAYLLKEHVLRCRRAASKSVYTKVSVDRETLEKVDELADALGTFRAELIRSAIEKLVAQYENMPVTRIAVAGSRSKYFKRLKTVKAAVFSLLDQLVAKYGSVELGHGASPEGGIDAIVEEYCNTHNVKCVRFEPVAYERWAYRTRNVRLVKWADLVVTVFVNRITPGTRHVMLTALSMRKPLLALLLLEERDVHIFKIEELKSF